MTDEFNWEERFVTESEHELKDEPHVRARIVGDRTYINVDTLEREYKLRDAYASVRNLEYRADEAIEVQTFPQYLEARRAVQPLAFSVSRKSRPRYPQEEAYRNYKLARFYPRGDILVLVDQAVWDTVAASVRTWVLDVGRDGYWATIHVVSGGTPADVRNYIRARSRVGVLLVGAVAAPWFDLSGDQFPCDLYYMDLNGNWTDPDGDGKFNGHSGDEDPEIWVARLWTPSSGGNDAALINNYFARNHSFRQGRYGQARNALAFVDDDWQGFGDCALDLMFPSSAVTTYTAPDTTTAALYKTEVQRRRSWVQLCAHSWVHGHALKAHGTNDYVQMSYIRDTDPPEAHFYNLFCCGPGKYTVPDYMAGWYVFDKPGGGSNRGLTAIASAKSGSMLFFEDFYGPLGAGKCIGDAYVDWWKARGSSHGDFEHSWFYGLVLLGDPTLTWWKGAVPRPMSPRSGEVFSHYPRRIQFRWDPVAISGARYSIEIDAFHAISSGKWAEELGRTFFIRHSIAGTTFDHSFVGAQPGRWRVRATIGTTVCPWSPWQYFRFTV